MVKLTITHTFKLSLIKRKPFNLHKYQYPTKKDSVGHIQLDSESLRKD